MDSQHLEKLNLKLLNLSAWTTLLNYCPELEFKSNPKDRSFFYNVLNTLSQTVLIR